MYSTDYSDDIKYLAPGIHENVKLVTISKENAKKDGTGSEVISFHFEKDGYLFTHREFPVRADAKKEASEYLGRRIKHILGTFIPAEKIIFKINETNPERAWDLFTSKIVEVAGKAYEGQLFRIKIVLNNKDYQTFPGFAPFIQNMKEPNVLKITSKDKMTASVPDDTTQESSVDWASNLAEVPATSPF